jgi:hypothetical protein
MTDEITSALLSDSMIQIIHDHVCGFLSKTSKRALCSDQIFADLKSQLNGMEKSHFKRALSLSIKENRMPDMEMKTGKAGGLGKKSASAPKPAVVVPTAPAAVAPTPAPIKEPSAVAKEENVTVPTNVVIKEASVEKPKAQVIKPESISTIVTNSRPDPYHDYPDVTTVTLNGKEHYYKLTYQSTVNFFTKVFTLARDPSGNFTIGAAKYLVTNRSTLETIENCLWYLDTEHPATKEEAQEAETEVEAQVA